MSAARGNQTAMTVVPLIFAGLLWLTARFYRQQEREQERLAAQAMALAERFAVQLGEKQSRLVRQ